MLIDQVETPYLVFIDDDDLVADTYIDDHMHMISMGVDVIGFKGIMYTDNKNPTEFVHQYGKEYGSVRHGKYVTYERPIMHINVVRTEIAKKVKFPEKTFGEDRDYGIKLANSGLISSAGFIYKVKYL